MIPDDVKALAEPVLEHRLVLTTDAELNDVTPLEVIADVLETVEPPGSEPPEEDGALVGDATDGVE